MAHEITDTDQMAYVGEKPWHGLGLEFKGDESLTDWSNRVFGWTAQSCPVTYAWKGKSHAYPDSRILVRSDNGGILGEVSKDYKIVQPQQVVKFFQDLCETIGDFKMETLGSLRGGKRIWGLARAQDTIKLGKDDKIERFALMATSYDLTLATLVQQTSVRVVCNNTLSLATNLGQNGAENQLRFTHLQVFDTEVVKQKAALEQGWEVFSGILDKLASTSVKEKEAKEFFLDTYYPPAFREKSKRFFVKGAERQVNRMMEIFRDAPGQQLRSARGTAWGLVNAVTYQVDHEAKASNPEARLNSAWFGKGDEVKCRALSGAQVLAGIGN